jgi:uncharacterized protein YciI
MLFALLVTYGDQPPSEELMQAHRQWLYPQYERGSFLLSGVLEPIDGRPRRALAIIEADDVDAARALVDTEPFYRAGACTHEVIPFAPHVRTTGLDERLGDGLVVIERS